MKIKFKKPKSAKKAIIAAAVAVVVIIFIAYSCSLSKKANNIHANVSYTALKKTTIQNTVSVSGTVHSDNSHSVYTSLQYPVATISAYVGETVKKGDTLAVLDIASLEKDIKQQEYAVKSAEGSAAVALKKAKSDYESALSLYNNNLNSGIVTAKSQLDTAKASLQTEQKTYEYDKFLYGSGQFSKMELDLEKAKLDQAQSTYDAANKSLTVAQKKAKQDLQDAKDTYDDAVSKNSDKSQQITLEKLQQNLKDSVITAPADGVVTVNNAQVGAVAAGTLFKIEDSGNLIVDTQIKEIDSSSVKPGGKVSIKTDATGNDATAGTVISVAPAATAETQGTSNVTFAVKVRVTGKNSKLKIGMKAKMDIVLQECTNIYAVPYDALVEKPDGTYTVFAAESSGGLYKAKVIPVKTGLETDVSVVISGEQLKDGMRILSSPDGIAAGDTLQLAAEDK